MQWNWRETKLVLYTKRTSQGSYNGRQYSHFFFLIDKSLYWDSAIDEPLYIPGTKPSKLHTVQSDMRKEPLEAEAIPVFVCLRSWVQLQRFTICKKITCDARCSRQKMQNGRRLLDFSAMFLQVYVNFFFCNNDKNVNRNNKCTVLPSNRTLLIKLLL